MICIQKNRNSYIPTILFVALAFILISDINEKKDNLTHLGSTISLCIYINTNTPAVVPASTNIPICASFADENNIILDYSAVNDYQLNLKLSKEFNLYQEKQLLIKPLFNKVIGQLFYPQSDDGDSPAFS